MFLLLCFYFTNNFRQNEPREGTNCLGFLKIYFYFPATFHFPLKAACGKQELHRNHLAVLNCTVVETLVFHSLFFLLSFKEATHEKQNCFCVKFSCNWCFQRSLIRISCWCILLLIYYSQNAGKPSCGDVLHILRLTRSAYGTARRVTKAIHFFSHNEPDLNLLSKSPNWT